MDKVSKIKQSPRQVPLGQLLLDARKEKGWSRAKLAEETGINPSSIVRYEQAGMDGEDAGEAQFPPSTKLAKLCLSLGVDPLQALLGCLSAEEYSRKYEHKSLEHVWQHNQPQQKWVEEQLDNVTRDLMLLRSFISHFLPHIDRSNLPEDLLWLLEHGESELDRIAELEVRMLQLGVFILPMGSFLMPGGVTDEIGEHWIFDFGKPGVIQSSKYEMAGSIVRRSLQNYAERFVQLAYQLENIEELRPEHEDMLYRITCGREGKPLNKQNSEDDLPSPPSSESVET